MFLYSEVIKVIDGKFRHLSYHRQRVAESLRAAHLDPVRFDSFQHIQIPSDIGNGLYKCRFLYGDEVGDISFTKYEARKIKNARLVTDNNINYSLKYADRSALDAFMKHADGCDAVIIVKNGFITDSTFSNLAFSDGNKFYTPLHSLLNGTCRQRLIESGEITTMPITPADLRHFRNMHFINAMLETGDSVIDIGQINI